MIDEQAIITEMLFHIRDTLEPCQMTFGNLPICPFARQARLNHKIEFFVHSDFEDSRDGSHLIQRIKQFACERSSEVLMVIHPDRSAFGLATFDQYLMQINGQLSALQLVAFGGHPQDPFNVQGILTRQDPYINFVVQSRSKLVDASMQLQQTRYYENWSDANLESVFKLRLPN